MYVFRLSRHLTPLYVHLDCPTEDATPTPDLVEQDPDSFGGASRKTCSKASRYGRGTTRRQGALYALPTFDHNLRVVRAKDTEQALIRDGFHCVVSRIGDAWAVHHGFIPRRAARFGMTKVGLSRWCVPGPSSSGDMIHRQE